MDEEEYLFAGELEHLATRLSGEKKGATMAATSSPSSGGWRSFDR